MHSESSLTPGCLTFWLGHITGYSHMDTSCSAQYHSSVTQAGSKLISKRPRPHPSRLTSIIQGTSRIQERRIHQNNDNNQPGNPRKVQTLRKSLHTVDCPAQQVHSTSMLIFLWKMWMCIFWIVNFEFNTRLFLSLLKPTEYQLKKLK